MKFFYDTEFIEAGPQRPITLISLGMVSERGDTFYAISSEFDPADASEWVKDNVLSKLEPASEVPRQSLTEIAGAVQHFIATSSQAAGKDEPPVFYGYYSAYDHVVLCQIFGTMVNLPNGWPMFTRDLIQTAKEVQATWAVDVIRSIVGLPEGEHNALADAQWNKKLYDALHSFTALSRAGVESADWPVGTVLPATVAGNAETVLMVIDGRNQAHVLLATGHDARWEKGTAGKITRQADDRWTFTPDVPLPAA